MRRLLMMMPVAALAFTGFSPAQAGDDVYPTEDTPIIYLCSGTAGYEDTPSGPQWRTHTHDPVPDAPIPGVPPVPGTDNAACRAWAPDTATSPQPPPVPSDPTDPIKTFDELFTWAFLQARTSPVSLRASMDHFGAVGNFACGGGTLTEAEGTQLRYTNGIVHASSWWFIQDLTIDFSNGVGDVTGTVERSTRDGEVRDLSGTIVVDDGAAYGQCDDSAEASTYVAAFLMTPQD